MLLLRPRIKCVLLNVEPKDPPATSPARSLGYGYSWLVIHPPLARGTAPTQYTHIAITWQSHSNHIAIT